MHYGIPYMGSKNKIAKWVLSYLPKADNLYDIFCGGCAITHCAMEQRKYKNHYINDIKGEMPQAFIDCINGKYNNDYRWISRDDFEVLKGKGDMIVDVCFSFGNNWRKGYAYAKEIEPIKKALHYAILLKDCSLLSEFVNVDLKPLEAIEDTNERYSIIKKIIGQNNKNIQLENFNRLQNLERLIRLGELSNYERLNALNSIKSKSNIIQSSLSYDQIEILPNSVIYADPPYFQTAKYNDIEFDYDKFYEWCLKQHEPLYISEYDMPKSDFICIAAKEKTCSLSATNNSHQSVERLFIPKTQVNNKPLTLF